MEKSINEFLNECEDCKEVVISNNYVNDINYKIIYIIEMVDIRKFNYEIKPYINKDNINILDKIYLGLCIRVSDISKSNLEYLLYNGKILLFYNDNYYIFEFTNRPKRSISKSSIDPDDESRSQDGLIEDFNTNITLIKRRLKTNNLCVDKFTLGLITKTDTALLYLKETYNKKMLNKAFEILNSVTNQNIITINDISILFQNKELVPKTFLTSSPEIISTSILKGKIVIIIDNSPVACIIDPTFSTFTTSKSYVNTPLYYNIFNHIFIIIFMFIAIFMMGLFIALINYHTSIIPLPLLVNIKITERGTSWPMFFEVLIVYFLFEFYRFTTSRSTNNYIQNIIIILGGLFIGQNAIESGTIGATILFLTSISYIAIFAITNNIYLITSINIFRFFILLMSYLLGIIGFIVSSLIVILYLFKQKSDSNYYLYPFIPFNLKNFINFFKPNNMKETSK